MVELAVLGETATGIKFPGNREICREKQGKSKETVLGYPEFPPLREELGPKFPKTTSREVRCVLHVGTRNFGRVPADPNKSQTQAIDVNCKSNRSGETPPPDERAFHTSSGPEYPLDL
jgi:hypothetical protein